MTSKAETPINVALTLVAAIFVALMLASLVPSVQEPTAVRNSARVFVLREYMCESDKGPAKVIEYFVDGLPSIAVFYDGDAEQLEAFRKYLERVGR